MEKPLSKVGLAQAIYDMRYEDLRSVGHDLHSMTQSEDGRSIWDLSKASDWPEMLFAWAESVVQGEK